MSVPVPTIAEYAADWFRTVQATRKATTARRYEQLLRGYIVPALGALRIDQVTRAVCKRTLVDTLLAGRKKRTTHAVLAVMSAMLTAAVVDDEYIPYNPALGLARRLGLNVPRARQTDQIPALTLSETRSYLLIAADVTPRLAALFETYARAGLRLGEGLALRPEDINDGELRICRQYTDGHIDDSPKSGYHRSVEIGAPLEALLRARPVRNGWLFGSPRTTTPYDATYIGRLCAKIAARGTFPSMHPHVLRHTYASLLLAAGEPPEWVSRQLGHSRLDTTIGTYGRWLRMRNPRGVAALDQMLAGGDAPARPHGPLRLVPGERWTRQIA